jgi:hypothetical protein
MKETDEESAGTPVAVCCGAIACPVPAVTEWLAGASIADSVPDVASELMVGRSEGHFEVGQRPNSEANLAAAPLGEERSDPACLRCRS